MTPQVPDLFFHEGSKSDNGSSASMPSSAALADPSSAPLELVDADFSRPSSSGPPQLLDTASDGHKDVQPANANGNLQTPRGEAAAELQGIMAQFETAGTNSPDHPPDTSFLDEREARFAANMPYPPRRSSLDPIRPIRSRDSNQAPHYHQSTEQEKVTQDDASSSRASLAASPVQGHVPPLPEPEAEKPFDFHRFLEQLRHRTADPVAKFLRSFLIEFGKKPWLVHEQVKIVSDFLNFITAKMAQSEVWRDVSDAEFENAKEGMEKLVTSRIYNQLFSPAIPPPPVGPAARPRRGAAVPPGRRGQHQEDVERDGILEQKMRIYSWVRESHLDLAPLDESGHRFLRLAQQELLKINSYRAPRDKVICILNSCKVIFGLLRNSFQKDTSADAFMPLLILVVLRARPVSLVSNVQYILRFRSPEKLSGEAGYYVSSLLGATQFIENLDRTSLEVSDQEFERHVEEAVAAMAEKQEQSASKEPLQVPASREPVAPSPASAFFQTLQRPLSNLGRMFTDEDSQAEYPGNQHPTGHDGSRREADRPPSDIQTLIGEPAVAQQTHVESENDDRHAVDQSNIVDTLIGMFPSLDRDVIEDVVREKHGRVGSAVDACLILSA